MEITSKTNAKVKQWMKYHQKKHRDQEGMFLVEGAHLVEEAIQALQLDCLLIRNGCDNIFEGVKNVYEVQGDVLDKLSTNVSNVDYIGVCRRVETCFKNFDRVILLDDIQDPGNLGTIVRTAYSFGFQGVFLSENCCDLYNDKCIRSTQGALFHIPVKRVNIEEQIKNLQDMGYVVFATSLQNATSLQEVTPSGACAVIFGNEGQGVRPHILEAADMLIKIDMNAFESLNVAVAAGVCMYHFRKI